MDKNFIFLILLFLNSISNIGSLVFNVTNFVIMNYSRTVDIPLEKEHYFFIEAKKSQNATFYFHLSGLNPSIQYLSVNEYSDRSNGKPDIENEIEIIAVPTYNKLHSF